MTCRTFSGEYVRGQAFPPRWCIICNLLTVESCQALATESKVPVRKLSGGEGILPCLIIILNTIKVF
jgi:hypothetical protein